MKAFLEAERKGREESKARMLPTKVRDLSEYKEFQNVLEGLDRVKKVLPADHRAINRNMLQLHHLLKKSVREGGPYDHSKVSHAKVALSSLGFDSTQVEGDLMALKYDIGTGRARKITPFKGRDTDPYSRVEKSFEVLVQANIDQISKDLVAGLDHTLQMNLISDWTKKTRGLINFNKQFGLEETKYDYLTPARPEESRIIRKRREPRMEIVHDVTVPSIMIQGAPLAKYFDVITDYVEQKRVRRFSEKFSFVGKMRDAIATAENAEEAAWVWDLLDRQLGEFDPIQHPQGEFIKSYVQRNPLLMQQLIKKSCEYLESVFYNSLVGAATATEEMTLLALIDMYTKTIFGVGLKELPTKIQGLETEPNGWPVFAVMYYLIRAGQYKDAVDFAKRTQYKAAEEFANLLQIYMDHDGSLPNEALDQALKVLEVGHDSEIDPYKQALYIILTKHHKEPERRLQPYMEDYLWFYLKIVHTGEDEELFESTRAAYIPLTLGKFQQSILEMGSQFNPNGDDPLSYFKTLLLVGLYDHAIKYLAEYTNYFVHCTHYAIVLNEVGLLPNATLFKIYGIAPDYLEEGADVNYKELLMKYVEAIQYSYPKEAILYIALLDDNEVAKELAKFVIDTKNYEILLEANDLRLTPYTYVGDLTLTNLFGEKLYAKICHTVADHLKKTSDSLEVAMLLYDKIDMQKEVVNMWLQEQIEALEDINPLSFPTDGADYSMAENLKGTQQRHPFLFEKYEKMGVFEKYRKKIYALELLEKFSEFYSLAFQGRYEDSLHYIRQNRLLPIELEEPVEKYITEYTGMPKVVQQIMPNVELIELTYT